MSLLSILVVGATGNTGSSVVKHLSGLISNSSSSLDQQPWQIIALTRDANSTASKQLSQLNHVEIKEKDWTAIDSTWLIETKISRVYLAPHNLPHQFNDESKFIVECKLAKINYLVKLSTNIHYVTPDNPVYYGRAHWAVEHLLEQNEFKQLNWTVLRANYFMNSLILPALGWLKQKNTNDPLPLMLDEHAPIAMIDPQDIGEVAAKLLSLEDPSSHFRKKYNLSGPEDVTGKDVVSILEQITQKKIQVNYRDLTLFKAYTEKMGYPKSVSDSLESGRRDNLWIGLSRLENTPTSPEILQLAPPHSTIKQFIQQAFNQ
ncbi:unnamed protein product [Adineta steineri]|uniref:NmrA-like family domain-containing protein 1 n=1 Tax=Adineta steineri TaxID=433720 RepID=A0A814KZG4_9BILA|nr:unnamed protein product [Adineta steineri]CAF1125557.1 unnamed protein product [Adineta steineri]